MPKASAVTIYNEPARPGSHPRYQRAELPNELDPKRVNIVPLPPSPNAWERPVDLPATDEAFADPQRGWSEIVVEEIARSDRPDPAFRKHYSKRDGALSFDDLAKSEASLGAPGAVIFSDANGRLGQPAPLHRDAYHCLTSAPMEQFCVIA